MIRTYLTVPIAFTFLLRTSAGFAADSDERFVVTPQKPSLAIKSDKTPTALTTKKFSTEQTKGFNREKAAEVTGENLPKIVPEPLNPFSPHYIDP